MSNKSRVGQKQYLYRHQALLPHLNKPFEVVDEDPESFKVKADGQEYWFSKVEFFMSFKEIPAVKKGNGEKLEEYTDDQLTGRYCKGGNCE